MRLAKSVILARAVNCKGSLFLFCQLKTNSPSRFLSDPYPLEGEFRRGSARNFPCEHDRHAACASQEHEDAEHNLRADGQRRGDTRRKADGGNGRDNLEHRLRGSYGLIGEGGIIGFEQTQENGADDD